MLTKGLHCCKIVGANTNALNPALQTHIDSENVHHLNS